MREIKMNRNLFMNNGLAVRILMAAAALLIPFAAPAATQGPDGGGYSATDQSVYSFIDISGAGGGTSVLSGVDDGAVALTIPFGFTFYGSSYTQVCASSNGAIYFVSAASTCSSLNDFANIDLSGASPAPDLPALYPFWTDLTFQDPGAGSVFYQTIGTPGNRRFIVQWNTALPQGDTSGVTFEVILSEGTNAVSFQYRTVALGGGDANANGATATVGIHNASGLGVSPVKQLQWSYNAAVLSNGYVISFQTSSAPGAPTLTSPTNAATNVATPVTLTWNVATGATAYDVYFGTLVAPPLATSGITSLSYTPASLAAGTTYYWQVVAKNGTGSTPSGVFSFTTAAASGGGGGGGGGGGPILSFNPLSAAPTSLSMNGVAGGPVVTQSLTLNYSTSTTGTFTYLGSTVTNQGFGWLSFTPSSGTFTQGANSGSSYTYSTTVTVKADPSSLTAGNVYTGVVNVQSGNGIVSVPITFTITAQPVPQPTGGIANAASAGQATPSLVSLGSYIAIYGTALGGSGNPNATSLPLPTLLNGVSATLGGLPMPLLYASPTQINALIPQGLTPGRTYPLVVTVGTTASAPIQLTVAELQPGIYTVNTSGSGAGIVTEALTGQLNSATNPAKAGDYLVIYGTGLGAVQGPNGQAGPADGAVAPSSPLFRTISTVTATIGGVNAQVSFSGLTPTFAGLYQVNVQMPAGVTPGSAVPVVLTVTDSTTGATAKSNTVTIVTQ